jgi:hypothetical protein
MVLVCGTPEISKEEYLGRWNKSKLESIEDSGQNLYVSIEYVVIPLNESQNIGDTAIQSQHDALNQYYSQTNDQSKAPQNDNYPHKNQYGNPKIQFSPADKTQITITRFGTSSHGTGFTSVDDVENHAKTLGFSPTVGRLTIYICNLITSTDGTLLGIARNIGSNAAAISYGTVGSSTNVNQVYPTFGNGAVLAHEIGHCFALYHPHSSDGDCTSNFTAFIQSLRPECPLQINTNEYADIDYSNTGTDTSNGKKCNAHRDYMRYTLGDDVSVWGKSDDTASVSAYSCISQPLSATTKFECYTSVMETTKVNNMMGFFGSSSTRMRSWLLSSGSVTVTEEDGTVISASSGSSFPSWAIGVIISVVVVVLIIILVGINYKKKQSVANMSPYFQQKKKRVLNE